MSGFLAIAAGLGLSVVLIECGRGNTRRWGVFVLILTCAAAIGTGAFYAIHGGTN